jgi:hypothetical protein
MCNRASMRSFERVRRAQRPRGGTWTHVYVGAILHRSTTQAQIAKKRGLIVGIRVAIMLTSRIRPHDVLRDLRFVVRRTAPSYT